MGVPLYKVGIGGSHPNPKFVVPGTSPCNGTTTSCDRTALTLSNLHNLQLAMLVKLTEVFYFKLKKKS